jgi:hypothetical protein
MFRACINLVSLPFLFFLMKNAFDTASFTYRNKFCFTGGYVEVNVELPGANNVLGFWPAIWAVGNLGRAGYGASLEGIVRIVSLHYRNTTSLIPVITVAIFVRQL